MNTFTSTKDYKLLSLFVCGSGFDAAHAGMLLAITYPMWNAANTVLVDSEKLKVEAHKFCI